MSIGKVSSCDEANEATDASGEVLAVDFRTSCIWQGFASGRVPAADTQTLTHSNAGLPACLFVAAGKLTAGRVAAHQKVACRQAVG